jgi:hypothetical protein
MTKQHTIDLPDLNAFNTRLEQLLEEHAAACRAAVIAAAERAFPADAFQAPKESRAREPRRRPLKGSRRPRLVKPLARRTPAEMAGVCDRLYQAVCTKPGESKAVLAAAVGISARELDRPMNHLKNAGKVRTVGQRHLTRYFPLVGEATQAQ